MTLVWIPWIQIFWYNISVSYKPDFLLWFLYLNSMSVIFLAFAKTGKSSSIRYALARSPLWGNNPVHVMHCLLSGELDISRL